MKKHLDAIKQVFAQLGHVWVEPYVTTEGAINRKEAGNHRGLYYIYPEENFYFGKAATNTVYARHKTHRAKLDVDLAGLYSTPVEKAEPKWTFPEGWKDGVSKFIVEGNPEIPSHFVRVGKGRVAPGVLNFPVRHKVNVDTLTVVVWNLDHLTAKQISEIEEAVIPAIWPYCNTETYQKRIKESQVQVDKLGKTAYNCLTLTNRGHTVATFTKEQIAEYKKPFDAVIAYQAAAYAYRVQGNRYLNADRVTAERYKAEDAGVPVPNLRANKDIMFEAIENPALLTEEDKTDGESCQRYFRGLMFRKLAGEKLNGFLETALQVVEKNELARSNRYELAIIASLPQTYQKEVKAQEAKLARAEFARDNAPVGSVGDKLQLNVTVDACFFSENYFVHFVTAKADSGHTVRFTYKNSLDVGKVCKIKGTIKHFEDDGAVCRMNRVSIL